MFQDAEKLPKFIIACASTRVIHAYHILLPDKKHAYDDTKQHETKVYRIVIKIRKTNLRIEIRLYISYN